MREVQNRKYIILVNNGCARNLRMNATFVFCLYHAYFISEVRGQAPKINLTLKNKIII